MAEVEREPKPLFPFLESFYRVVVPLAWPLVRLTCGFHLIIHGWGKVVRGGTVSNSTLAFGLFLTFIEFVGGICITIGLFTRFFAAAVAIEMAYLTFMCGWPPPGKRSFDPLHRDRLQSCVRPLMQPGWTAGPDGVREPSPHHSNGIECPDEASGLSRLRRIDRLCHHESLLLASSSVQIGSLSRRGRALVILLPVHHR